MLVNAFLSLLSEGWSAVFAQRRTRERAASLCLACLCAFGRRTVSRAICAAGRQHGDWSADYKLFSRSAWDEDRLFDPVLLDWLGRYPDGPVCAALDDTRFRRSGRKVATAFWQRDPLSPPFRANLLFGQRFMQASLLYPHYREGDFGARGVPVRFAECPAAKKPGKRATEEEREAYRAARKETNLSAQGLEVLRGLRQRLDDLGGAGRPLLVAVDGSLCNSTVFKAPLDRTDVVARSRKDARLCLHAPPSSRRFYAEETFTPQDVLKDDSIPWRVEKACFGGKWRKIRCKEVPRVLWRGGAGRRPLRLLVLAPQPYKASKNSRTHYRQPAFLLTTDLDSPAGLLIQVYLDRWQIEVNIRDEKDLLGVGQAQVWSRRSSPRQPAFVVAGYSLLLLAALKAFGPGRSAEFVPLPKWRKEAKRPSALDLITLLRKEVGETQDLGDLMAAIQENIVLFAYS